jgi:rsbT co-antagonist protein RsbR
MNQETTAQTTEPFRRPTPPLGPQDTTALFRLLVENVRDYAIILLDTRGHVLSWNPAAERLKGYRAEDILGQHFSRFYLPEEVQQGKPEHALQRAAAEGRWEDEGWRVRQDGTRFWAHVVLTALRDAQGQLQGFGKVTRDLTERRQAEETIRQQAQEILEMATVPVVQVWPQVVLVPLIGTLNRERMHHLVERLLQHIVDTHSLVACVDITGVPTIDTYTAQHLIDTISAVRLMGAEVILTGVRPSIAQTLVHLGIELSSIVTRASLMAGLAVALEKLHLRVVSSGEAH